MENIRDAIIKEVIEEKEHEWMALAVRSQTTCRKTAFINLSICYATMVRFLSMWKEYLYEKVNVQIGLVKLYP